MPIRLGKRPIASSRNTEPPKPTFTADDLVAALSSLATKEQVAEGLTATEWQETTGWPISRVNKTLRDLFRAKRLRVTRTQRDAIDGSRRWVPSYSILPK